MIFYQCRLVGFTDHAIVVSAANAEEAAIRAADEFNDIIEKEGRHQDCVEIVVSLMRPANPKVYEMKPQVQTIWVAGAVRETH